MNTKPPRENRFASNRKKRGRSLLVFIALVAALAVVLFFTTRPEKEPFIEERVIEKSASEKVLPKNFLPGPFQKKADRLNSRRKLASIVKRKETFSTVLTRMGLTQNQVFELTKAASKSMNLRKVLPGAKVIVFVDKETGKPLRLEYSKGADGRIIISATKKGYVSAAEVIEPLVVLAGAMGNIKFSLWESAVERGNLSPDVVMALTDIFAYDIDFFTDIQKGDKFKLLFTKKYRLGKPMGSGRILAAEFINNGRKLTAYYYENSKGKGGYYTESGRSLRKMFLKSPLRYSRISSHFSRSRMHPILKIYRPHLGVDYAAPSGTPVETVGDGSVYFKGWAKGYGKMIKIKHNRTYTTLYAHLSGYARGIRKGSRVKQGQLIAYVGKTGLATGPHLDFRLKKNNKFINPLSLKSAPAPPIKKAEKKAFLAMVRRAKIELSDRLALSN